MNQKKLFIMSMVGVAAAGTKAPAQTPLGTAFTYQGRLDQSGSPVNGTADFQFSLFDAASAGNLIAGPVSVSNVTVANGLFTVSIDFGAAAFNGQARWLSTSVRSPAGGGSFTPLTSRQKLTGAPYALKVPGIDGFSLDAADGSPTDALFVDSAGNVGIGTLTPGKPVHVRADEPALRLEDSGSPSTQTGYVEFNSSAGNTGWVGYGTPGSPHFSAVNARSGGNIVLSALGSSGDIVLSPGSGGGVGIGTDAPTHSLHIANAAPTLALQDTNSTSDQVGYVSYRDSGNVERAWVGYGTPGSPHFSVVNARSGGDIVLSPGAGGVVSVPVLEITGADLAEKFPTSDKVEAGMVVAINPANAGKLCLARGAYNRCVAGVVSGGNNFSAGAVLGNLPGCEDAPPVALSGRVYVWCDAASGAIQPGDLLTTSETPGHAMKAVDRDRSHGAVIGKAMSALESGRGMVLVLVNLQ